MRLLVSSAYVDCYQASTSCLHRVFALVYHPSFGYLVFYRVRYCTLEGVGDKDCFMW